MTPGMIVTVLATITGTTEGAHALRVSSELILDDPDIMREAALFGEASVVRGLLRRGADVMIENWDKDAHKFEAYEKGQYLWTRK